MLLFWCYTGRKRWICCRRMHFCCSFWASKREFQTARREFFKRVQQREKSEKRLKQAIFRTLSVWQRTHKMIQTQRRFFWLQHLIFSLQRSIHWLHQIEKWLQHKIKKCNTRLFNATQNKKCNTKKWSTQLQVLKLSASFFSIIDVKCVDFHIPFIGQDFFCFLVEFFVGFEVKVFSFFGALINCRTLLACSLSTLCCLLFCTVWSPLFWYEHITS